MSEEPLSPAGTGYLLIAGKKIKFPIFLRDLHFHYFAGQFRCHGSAIIYDKDPSYFTLGAAEWIYLEFGPLIITFAAWSTTLNPDNPAKILSFSNATVGKVREKLPRQRIHDPIHGMETFSLVTRRKIRLYNPETKD